MESETVTPLDVVIGLGANIGSPEASLCDAALQLSQLGRQARVIRCADQ